MLTGIDIYIYIRHLIYGTSHSVTASEYAHASTDSSTSRSFRLL